MSATRRCDVCGTPAPRSSEYNRVWYKIKRDSWGVTFDVCPECAKACGISHAFAEINKKYDAAWAEIVARVESGE